MSMWMSALLSEEHGQVTSLVILQQLQKNRY